MPRGEFWDARIAKVTQAPRSMREREPVLPLLRNE